MTRKTTTTTLAAITATVALIFGTAACGADDSDCQGDPGKVTDRDTDTDRTTTGTGKNKSTTTTTTYEITILKADGTTYEKDVSSSAYDWYVRGAKFPHPKHCTDGKVND